MKSFFNHALLIPNNSLNVLYDSVTCTISLKVRKMYYIIFNSDLYYKSTLKTTFML